MLTVKNKFNLILRVIAKLLKEEKFGSFSTEPEMRLSSPPPPSYESAVQLQQQQEQHQQEQRQQQQQQQQQLNHLTIPVFEFSDCSTPVNYYTNEGISNKHISLVVRRCLETPHFQ